MLNVNKSSTQLAVIHEQQLNLTTNPPNSLFWEEDGYYCSPEELMDLEHGGTAVALGLKVSILLLKIFIVYPVIYLSFFSTKTSILRNFLIH